MKTQQQRLRAQLISRRLNHDRHHGVVHFKRGGVQTHSTIQCTTILDENAPWHRDLVQYSDTGWRVRAVYTWCSRHLLRTIERGLTRTGSFSLVGGCNDAHAHTQRQTHTYTHTTTRTNTQTHTTSDTHNHTGTVTQTPKHSHENTHTTPHAHKHTHNHANTRWPLHPIPLNAV